MKFFLFMTRVIFEHTWSCKGLDEDEAEEKGELTNTKNGIEGARFDGFALGSPAAICGASGSSHEWRGGKGKRIGGEDGSARLCPLQPEARAERRVVGERGRLGLRFQQGEREGAGRRLVEEGPDGWAPPVSRQRERGGEGGSWLGQAQEKEGEAWAGRFLGPKAEKGGRGR